MGRGGQAYLGIFPKFFRLFFMMAPLNTSNIAKQVDTSKEFPKGFKRYQCEKCKEKFAYFRRFNDHKVKALCDSVFKCNQCDTTFKTTSNLKKHVKRVHESILFKCCECDKPFPTQKSVNNHYLFHHVPFMCKYCKKSFKNSNTWRSHVHMCQIRKKEKISTQQNQGCNPGLKMKKFNKECEHCGKPFSSKSGFNKHIRQHKMAADEGISKSVNLAGNVEEVETTESVDEVLWIVESNDNQNSVKYTMEEV